MVASVLTVVFAFPADAAINKDGHITLSGSDYLIADSFSNGSGDMDFIFYAAADDWSATGTQVVIGHWPSTASKQAARVQFTKAGHLQLVVKDTGGGGTTYSAWSSDMNLVNGRGYWFRVRFNAKTANGSTTKFYVSGQRITTGHVLGIDAYQGRAGMKADIRISAR